MKTKHESPRALALISVSDKTGIIDFARRLAGDADQDCFRAAGPRTQELLKISRGRL